jgi:Protein of unknown function (DUF3224)
MSLTAKGTFEIELVLGPAELDGAVQRFALMKTFHGDLAGTGTGVMLSSGDPQSGEAGYVAMEKVTGQLGDRTGSFALQQFGTMHAGSQNLYYQVVPGSGHDALAGITGSLHLTIENDGTHRYELEYEI